MKLLQGVVALNRAPVVGGQWFTARADSPESFRDRIGRQVSTVIDGTQGMGLRVTDPFRLLTPDQLLLVYCRTPDVRAAIDGIARRVSTYAWSLAIEEGVDDVDYEDAVAVAAETTRFLKCPNSNGETWQELLTKLVTDLLVYEQGAMETVFDKLVDAPVPGLEGKTMRVPASKAKLQELVALLGCSVMPLEDGFGHLLAYQQDVYGTLGPLSVGGRMGDPVSGVPHFSREQMVLFRLFPNTSGRLSPLIETIVNEVITILRSGEHAMLAMDADQIPPGLLVLTGVAGKAAEQAKADLQRQGGKDHRIRVITSQSPSGAGAHWVELRRTPKDLSMLEVMAEVRRTIWRIFGVMPIEMGVTDNLPRAVGEVQLSVGASHLIEPILDIIEAKFNARILPRLVGEKFAGKIFLRFDREAKLSATEQKDKAGALTSLVKEGILTRNEARVDLDQPPIEGGDVATIASSTGLQRVSDLSVPVVPGVPSEGAPPAGGAPAPSVAEPKADTANGNDSEAAPGEAAPSTLRVGLVPALRALDLPSDWPSAARFRGYRTLPLHALAQVVSRYNAEITPEYNATMEAVLAVVARDYDGTLTSDAATRTTHAIAGEIDKLQARWALLTMPLYEQTAQLARNAASNFTGAPVVADWRAKGNAYGVQAMHYLTAADGLLSDVEARIAAILARATSDAVARGTLASIVPGIDEQTLLEAVATVFAANRNRIDNWAGRLVELANVVFADGMAEGVASSEPGKPSPEEWYVEWVAVGDDAMCQTCSAEGALGIRPAATLHRSPGGSTECRARCRCVLVWWTRAEVASGEAVSLSGAAPGNKQLSRPRPGQNLHPSAQGQPVTRAEGDAPAVMPKWATSLLVSHYSGAKISRAAVQRLAMIRDQYAELQPPAFERVYRGIGNLTGPEVKRLIGESPDHDGACVDVSLTSNADRDVSWSLSADEAVKFAAGCYTDQDPAERRYMVVFAAKCTEAAMPMALNPKLMAEVPEVGGWFNDAWGETLRRSILQEREVAAHDCVQIMRVYYAHDQLTLTRLVMRDPEVEPAALARPVASAASDG